MPERTIMSVVLPAPFAPSSAWISPRRTSKSTRSSATVPGNVFVSPETDSRMSSAVARSGIAPAGLQSPELREQLLHALPLSDPPARGLFAIGLRARPLEDRAGLGARHHHDADLVGHDNVPRGHDDPAAVDRHVHLDRLAAPRERGVRRARPHGPAVEREPEVPRLVDVAHRAIDHGPGDAAP